MTMHWSEARDALRKAREGQSQDSVAIIDMAKPLLGSNAGKLGDEVYQVYEQACVAAMDCGMVDLQKQYLKVLQDKFGADSVRVGILQGMELESRGEWDKATTLYEKLSKMEEGNKKAVLQRQVAVLIGQGQDVAAIEKLTAATDMDLAKALREKEKPVDGKSVIEQYQTDPESWQMLGNLYLKVNDLASAQFCFEELILSNPFNYMFHQRNAEVLYSMGDNASMELAFKYYAKAAQLNPESTRAAYGLLLSAEKLNTKRAGGGSGGYATELAERAQELLQHQYTGAKRADALDSMLALINKSKSSE